MVATTDSRQACLASTALDDPTRTTGVRENFVRELRKRFRRVRGEVRRAVGYEHDVFGLRRDAALAPDLDDVERFDTDGAKIEAFTKWLRRRFRSVILSPVDERARRNGEHYTATFLRVGFHRGWEQAADRLEAAGASIDRVEDVFEMEVPQRQLRKLYTRTYEELRSVTEAAAPRVREVLTEGLDAGDNPRKMAARLTKEIRSIQRTRAETLARTEIIHSHSEATVTRYERAGVETVQHGEWATADDDRVCPVCESLEGREIPMDGIRDATFEFDPPDGVPDSLGGTYRLMPPAHPNGRCTLLPVIG